MSSSTRNTITSKRAAAFTAAVAFALCAAFPAYAQRLSLAERVDKLEQQQSQSQGSAQGNIELINQINALQSQLQSLQGQNEEMKHQLDLMKQQSKDQYIDLDSRIGRMEGHAPAGAAVPSSNNNTQLQDVPLGQNVSPAARQQDPGSASAPPAVLNDTSNPADERAAYDQAFQTLKDGRYAESAQLFQSFTTQYPNSELAPNAYLWLGESYYVTQNYPVALDTFNILLAKYPNSAKASAALLKVGYCQYEMKQWDRAETTLNEVVQKFPGTQEANLAQGRLRALKMERR